MKVTRFIDRKLILVVSGPIVRHLANALSLYLAGQGVSSGIINQVEAALIAGAALAVNVLFEVRDQGNVAEKAANRAANIVVGNTGVPLAFTVRDRFDRESV